MFSNTRTISTRATLRASASIQSVAGEPAYDCEIRSAYVADGWMEHLTKSAQLILDPSISAEYDNKALLLSMPKMVFAKETIAATTASMPPGSDTVELMMPELDVSRLDTVDTDEQATLEFRLQDIALPAIAGQTTSDFNRIYLVATSNIVEVNPDPAASVAGAAEPGVLHDNLAGDQVFDPSTDLYVLESDGGAIVTDSNTYPVWLKRTDIVADPIWSSEIVLAVIDVRNVAADDVDVDILRGSATAICNITFRLII